MSPFLVTPGALSPVQNNEKKKIQTPSDFRFFGGNLLLIVVFLGQYKNIKSPGRLGHPTISSRKLSQFNNNLSGGGKTCWGQFFF